MSRALFGMLEAMVDEPAAAANGAARRPREPEQDELLEQVRGKRLKEDTLSAKLRDHIEQSDATAALENVTATSAQLPRQDIFLSPFNEARPTLPEMHHAHFVLVLPKGVLA